MKVLRVVFETSRLRIRYASVGDRDLLHRLWTDPRVMKNVGFPKGLLMTKEQVGELLRSQPPTEFGRLLIAELKVKGEAIGEAHMKLPNDEAISKTDVKILPEHWGNKYGVEIKQGLLDHLFGHTDCQAVEAGPNVENHASIRMQEAVGGVRIGEATYEFPESMSDYTCPVHHYIYRVDRKTWEQRSRG
jgi:RimJ/RimL family protein N-acetyltransferase